MRSGSVARTFAASFGPRIVTARRAKMLAHSFTVALMNPGHSALEIWFFGSSFAGIFGTVIPEMFSNKRHGSPVGTAAVKACIEALKPHGGRVLAFMVSFFIFSYVQLV